MKKIHQKDHYYIRSPSNSVEQVKTSAKLKLSIKTHLLPTEPIRDTRGI